MTASGPTVVSRLKELSRGHPELEALISYDEEMIRSYLSVEEFFTLSARFAFILKQEGVLPGDYITITVPLSLEAALITFGVIMTGAVPANLETVFTSGEDLIQCMGKLKSRLVIVRSELYDDVFNYFNYHTEGSERSSSLMRNVSVSCLPFLKRLMRVQRSVVRERSFVETLRMSSDEYVYEGIHPFMTAFLHLTTGTEMNYFEMTEISHLNTIKVCDSMQASQTKEFDKYLQENPWSRVSSLPFDILNGSARVFPDKWHPINNYPKMMLNIMETEGITHAHIQPLTLIEITKVLGPQTSEPLLEQLNIDGIPFTRSLLNRIQPLAKTICLIFSSSESGPSHYHLVKSENLDTFNDFDNGIPFAGVQCRIVDETLVDVDPGTQGRILLKTPGMFQGYPCESARTMEKFDKEFWFITSDRGHIDPSTNHLYVEGNKETVIIHGQYTVYPSWIEKMITFHPNVKEVVALPVPHDLFFQTIGVCCSRQAGTNLSIEDIQQKISDIVLKDKAHIFQPTHIFFFDELPRTGNNQLDRNELKKFMNDTINQ